jgi:hypothetical protein
VEVSKLVLEGDGYEQGFFDHPFLFLSSIHQSEQVGQCFFWFRCNIVCTVYGRENSGTSG